MFKLGKRSLANLEGVHPTLVSIVKDAIAITKQDFTVIEGLRTLKRQQELVAQGASRTMKSRHLRGFAVDLMPYGVDDVWNTRKPEVLKAWQDVAHAMTTAAERRHVNIEWGGDWARFVDMPHFELHRSDYP